MALSLLRVSFLSLTVCLFGFGVLCDRAIANSAPQGVPGIPSTASSTTLSQSSTEDLETPIPTVAELSDVRPSDWAYQALIRLVEQYGVLSGYPDGTFGGEQPLSRYEFASALSEALLIIRENAIELSRAELEDINRLEAEFAAELIQLEQQMVELEERVQQLAEQQFSPVVRFSGQVITALTLGDHGGDEIIAPRGALVTDDAQKAFFLNRVTLFFNTSFKEDDLLQLRIVSGSNGPNDTVAGNLEPNFGSTLDYAIQGRDNSFSMARAYYSFYPTEDLQVVIAPLFSIADYVDSNSKLVPSFKGFSTQAFATNFVLLPRPFGAGAAVDWNPGGSAFSIRAAYVAGDISNTTGENTRLIGGGGPEDVQLFPTSGGSPASGLFGDPHQGFVELEYAPVDRFAIRFQYAGGQIFGSDFDGGGTSVELAVTQQLAVFGKYAFSRYKETTLGELTPQYWMAGLTYSSLFREFDLSGFAVVQPFVEDSVGDATQTTFEAFYNFPATDSIAITPFAQVITNPANQDSNGTIYSGGLRMVFSF